MADMGIGAGFGAGGAVEGLQALLQQRLQAAALAETLRKNQADEALRQQQIDEQAKTRQMMQAGLQQDRTVNEAARIAGSLSPGDSLLQNPGAQNPSLSPVVQTLVQGGQGSNIGVVPPLNASPIPNGAQVPALPSGSDSGTPSGPVLRTGPSLSAPLTPPAPGAIGNVTWLGTPAERKQLDLEQKQKSYLRTLDPNSREGQAAAFEAAMGRPAPAGMFEKQTTHLVPVVGPGGKPQLINEADAAGMQPFEKPTPQATVTIQTIDDKGNPITRVMTKSEALGKDFAKGPGQTIANRLASAKAVSQTGEDIIRELSDPQFAQLVGPAMGRYNTLRDFIGNPPPEFAQLAGQIESYALANMGVHGMRSAQGAAQISALLDKKHTPASMIATIQGLNGFSQHFIENERGTGAAPKTQAAGGGVIYARDPHGTLHQAPAGTALPAGWKAEKGPQ